MLAVALALVAMAVPPPTDDVHAVSGAPAPVYELHPAIDLPVMIAGGLAIAVPSLFASDLIHKRCPCDPSGINGLDRGAVGNHDDVADAASNVTVGVAMLAPPLLDLFAVGTGKAFRTDVAVFAETLLVNGGLVEIAKYTVQRPLPRTYAGDAHLIHSPGGYRSFYSGHTSTTFAALTASAMTMRLRYGEQVWPWAVAGVVGTSVAIERVAAGRHFPTDVIVGAAAGSIVGIAVPVLHARRSPVTLVPAPHGVGIAVHTM